MKRISFHPREQIAENLDQAFELISSYLHSSYHLLLKSDFEVFLQKGRFKILNTFHGGILFLKVPEAIERIRLDYFSDRSSMIASVEFTSDQRAYENIKSKPEAGKIESIEWHLTGLFPHIHQFPEKVQYMLLVILQQMVKAICESYQGKPYMQIENAFYIELSVDHLPRSTEKVELKKD